MTSSIPVIFASAGVGKALCKSAHQLTLDNPEFLPTTLENSNWLIYQRGKQVKEQAFHNVHLTWLSTSLLSFCLSLYCNITWQPQDYAFLSQWLYHFRRGGDWRINLPLWGNLATHDETQAAPESRKIHKLTPPREGQHLKESTWHSNH